MTRYEYIVEPKAQNEYDESILWYLERSLLATENFISTVDDAFLQICEFPYRWKNLYKNFYEYGLKKYPFHIIYTIDDEMKTIVIFSIYHQKRNPKKKYKHKK